jgi:hypothetical protein
MRMADWVSRDPPLASKDRLHLQYRGYAQSADALFKFIMVIMISTRKASSKPYPEKTKQDRTAGRDLRSLFLMRA